MTTYAPTNAQSRYCHACEMSTPKHPTYLQGILSCPRCLMPLGSGCPDCGAARPHDNAHFCGRCCEELERAEGPQMFHVKRHHNRGDLVAALAITVVLALMAIL